MWESLLLVAALAITPECDALGGWNAGRSGDAAQPRCDSEDYREAHRLGNALKDLLDERARIARKLPALGSEAQAAALRRQRQLDVDLEAIRGLATVKAWPLDPAPEFPP